MKVRGNQTWVGVALLVAVEQAIKLIINANFLESSFAILPPLLYFEPVFNRKYSWLNSMLGLENSKWIHVIVVAGLLILIYLFYRFLNRELGSRRIINVLFAFVFSGAVCSVIDKVCWNGSLDYILLDHLFTFDLKDVYINVFLGLLVVAILLKNKTLAELDDRDILQDFGKYLRRKS